MEYEHSFNKKYVSKKSLPVLTGRLFSGKTEVLILCVMLLNVLCILKDENERKKGAAGCAGD